MGRFSSQGTTYMFKNVLLSIRPLSWTVQFNIVQIFSGFFSCVLPKEILFMEKILLCRMVYGVCIVYGVCMVYALQLILHYIHWLLKPQQKRAVANEISIWSHIVITLDLRW